MINDSGQAFPVGYGDGYTYGMTLRDYFAAKAMQGFWASGRANLDKKSNMSELAENAYEQADLMLEARK